VKIDTIAFVEALAAEMNAHPERYHILGHADMVGTMVVQRAGGDFRARVTFAELRCDGVDEVEAGEPTDWSLVGPLDAWHEMFDDVLANGRATGLQTINSLALLGDRIELVGDDPMGLDKFSRFNQTLQAFLDGAARLAVSA